MAGTVNMAPLLAMPETVTTTFPVVAPLGTVIPIAVVTAAANPLRVTVLLP
jgi:hypothetical protein